MLSKIKHRVKSAMNFSSGKRKVICVEIYSQNNHFITRGKIVGNTNKTIIVSNDLGIRKAPTGKVKLTIKDAEEQVSFVMGKLKDWSKDSIEIGEIELIQQGERRGFFRVRAFAYGHLELEEDYCPIQLMDLSLGGGCIMSLYELEVGKSFPIKLDLEDYTLNTLCRVVRKIDEDTYGVSFDCLSEAQLSDLYMIILELQKKMIQKQKYVHGDSEHINNSNEGNGYSGFSVS